MGDAPSKAQLRRTWEAAAPGWAKWEPSWALTDATDAMIDAAGVEPGMNVLDVACGAGTQTLRAARRVGVSGRVLASDISSTMLEYLRTTAADAGLANVSTVVGAAEELQLPPASFDAAICRLGLMLFASPANALSAVYAALKPGARLAALVFTTPPNNPFMAEPMTILLQHAGAQPAGPGTPGLFALGGEGVLEGLLSESGLTNVTTSTVRAPFRLPSADDALLMFQEAAGAYRAVVAHLAEADRAAAWADVRDNLLQFETPDAFEAELEFVIGSGARPD
ncbi:MAG: methyltransferase domain-containing protein [Actinomycetota bacterium]|nr:methyltransferase domain-containing protein [Actinomycetota bacterium]